MVEGLLPGFGQADVWKGAQADVTARAVDGPTPDPVLGDRLPLARLVHSESESVLVAVDAGPVHGSDEGGGQLSRLDGGLFGNRTLVGHACSHPY